MKTLPSNFLEYDVVVSSEGNMGDMTYRVDVPILKIEIYQEREELCIFIEDPNKKNDEDKVKLEQKLKEGI